MPRSSDRLNTLLCINDYIDVILWKRPLTNGLMIHRNTMIATGDALYPGEDDSGKVIMAQLSRACRSFVSDKLHKGPHSHVRFAGLRAVRCLNHCGTAVLVTDK